MEFIDAGEKIKKLRKELNIKQEELEAAGVSRNFISMIENGKKKLPQQVAVKLMKILKNKAEKLGIELAYDEQWLMASAKEQAIDFCREKLKAELLPEDIEEIIWVVNDYHITELISEVYTLKANKLYDEGLYEEAFTYYYGALEAVNGKEQSREKAFIYNKLGACKAAMLNYKEAEWYFNKCCEYSILDDAVANKRKYLYNRMLCYYKLKQYDQVLDNLNSIVQLIDIDEDFYEYMSVLIHESNCYIETKRYDIAIRKLMDIIDKFKDPEDLFLGYIYNNLGVAYRKINELDKALVYIEKALAIRKEKDKFNYSHSILNKSRIFIEQNKEPQVIIDLINESISMSEEHNDYEFIIEGYELLKSYMSSIKSSDL